jgi:hypothetical protein
MPCNPALQSTFAETPMADHACPGISFDLEAEAVAGTRWLWHGLLAPGKLTLLTSLWKSGKTTLLAHFLARRRHGGDFLGLAVAPGGSLIVSEEPRDLWHERRRRHARARSSAC